MPTRWQPSKLIRHTFQCERPQPRGGLRPLVFSWRHPVLARLPSMLPLVALLPASSMLPIMASEPAWAMDTTAVHKKTARNPDFSFSMRGKANIFCYICRVDAACVRAVPQHRVGRCREAFVGPTKRQRNGREAFVGPTKRQRNVRETFVGPTKRQRKGREAFVEPTKRQRKGMYKLNIGTYTRCMSLYVGKSLEPFIWCTGIA